MQVAGFQALGPLSATSQGHISRKVGQKQNCSDLNWPPKQQLNPLHYNAPDLDLAAINLELLKNSYLKGLSLRQQQNVERARGYILRVVIKMIILKTFKLFTFILF